MMPVLLLGLCLLLACLYILTLHRRILRLSRLVEQARSDAYAGLTVSAALAEAGARGREEVQRLRQRRIWQRMGQEERRSV